MQDLNNDLVTSNQVLEMITVANEFCLFIEKIERLYLYYCINYLIVNIFITASAALFA